jgi:hypothetical protein
MGKEWRPLRGSSLGGGGTAPGAFDFEENSVQEDQCVSQIAQEVLLRQAKALAQRNGHSLEDARQAVSDTEAGRHLRDLASGEHRHERALAWQASVFWERAEQRWMHRIGSEMLSHFVAERYSTRE